MEKVKNYKNSIILSVISLVYIVLVKNFDVSKIGPKNSSVGFSKLNDFFRDFFSSNMTIYKITEVLGIVAILLVALYGFLGFMQLVRRKNVFRVDKEILSLGGLYACVLIIYVLFEKCIINYRPVLIDGKLEASFPSSHTMLAIVVCLSSVMVSKKYINKKYVDKFNLFTLVLMALIVLGRIISGVHWISDIIGGVLISLTLLSYFKCVISKNS